MKKVFSIKRYEEYMKKIGYSEKEIERSKCSWANDCEGLTAEEMMTKYSYRTSGEWMIEVEE